MQKNRMHEEDLGSYFYEKIVLFKRKYLRNLEKHGIILTRGILNSLFTKNRGPETKRR